MEKWQATLITSCIFGLFVFVLLRYGFFADDIKNKAQNAPNIEVTATVDHTATPKPDYVPSSFEYIHTSDDGLELYVDTDTNIMFTVMKSEYGVSINTIYNGDTPMLYDEWEKMHKK